MKQPKCYNRTYILADITEQDKIEAKKIAKSKGMTLQGWLGHLIKAEIAAKETRA